MRSSRAASPSWRTATRRPEYPPVRAATARILRAWSPQFLAFWACTRAISARSSADGATAHGPQPRPTACRLSPVILRRRTSRRLPRSSLRGQRRPIFRLRPKAASSCRLLAGVSRNDLLSGALDWVEERPVDRGAGGRVNACQLRGAGRGRETGAAGFLADRGGRISRPGWRLHRLPYCPRRQTLRWRPSDANAVRDALHVQHH